MRSVVEEAWRQMRLGWRGGRPSRVTAVQAWRHAWSRNGRAGGGEMTVARVRVRVPHT
jgi:hypothetical protein